MFSIGDIVRIYAPLAGKLKYHLCIKVADEGGAARFLFLNSDPSFADTFVVPCARVPCLPYSATGVTVFSFSTLPIYDDRRLKLFNAVKFGEIPNDVAQDMRVFVEGVGVMNKPDKKMVIDALDIIIARNAVA